MSDLEDALDYVAEWSCWQGGDMDGGQFQDEMIKRGLMVKVPNPPQSFIDEYGEDADYYVFRWHPAMSEPAQEERTATIIQRGGFVFVTVDRGPADVKGSHVIREEDAPAILEALKKWKEEQQ